MEKKLYNLTNPQKLIWSTEQFYPNTSINNISGTVILHETLNVDALKKAIYLFVQKNDAMRIQITTDHLLNVKQYVVPFTPFPIEIVSFKNEDALKKHASVFVRQPFTILDSSLFSFQIFLFPDGTGGFTGKAHHLLIDSWSSCSLGNEILSNYYDLVHHIPVSTEAKPSYFDFMQSQTQYAKSQKYITDQQFWQDKYTNTLPEVASFCPHYQNISHDYRGKREEFSLSKTVSQKVKKFCQENRISLFNLFLALYCIYLNKTTNLNQIVFGSPILNRKNRVEKDTIGMFVQTLPFSVEVDSSQTFLDFTKTITQQELTIFRHQKYPYMELLKYIRKQFHTTESLYQFMLSYQNSSIDFDKSKIDYSRIWSFNGYLLEPLNLHICDMDDDKISLYYDYQLKAFTAKDITDLHRHIINLLHQVLSSPSMAISQMELLNQKEIQHILYEFNRDGIGYPQEDTIVSLFEKQVCQTPERIAISFENQQLTYRELNEKANQLANYLIQHYHVQPHDMIGIRMNKSCEMIIAILAIIKCGACYLPINLSYPQDRIRYMLTDSDCRLLLTNHLSRNPDITIETCEIDLNNSAIYQDSHTANLNTSIQPDDLLYVIYTSGSTGNPKGVMITHRNVVRLLKNDAFDFDFSEKDVWTMFHSVAFDFSVWEMYGALLYGGKLILVPEETAKNPQQFLQLLRQEKVTVLNQTPTYFYNLLDTELKQPDAALCIRYIIYGGEALNPALIGKWKEKYPQTHLINMYGITETTVHVTFKELKEKDLKSSSSNIGVPIPTLKVYIMNQDMNLLPTGIEGQICVAGPGICKGYLHRDDLNQKKFIENPYIAR